MLLIRIGGLVVHKGKELDEANTRLPQAIHDSRVVLKRQSMLASPSSSQSGFQQAIQKVVQDRDSKACIGRTSTV